MNNPGAFLRQLPKADAVLRVCGCEDPELLSDYDFFCAVCRHSDRLAHHRLLLAAKAFLRENGWREDLSSDRADEIWKFLSEKGALREPDSSLLTPQACVPPPAETVRAGEFVPLERLLQETGGACDLDAFETRLREAFEASGRRGVLADLPDDLYEKQPNLYTLDLALKANGDASVLFLQALRIFARECVPLLVVLHGSGKKAAGFFSYLSGMLGVLSPIFCLLSEPSVAHGVGLLLFLGDELGRALLQEKDLSAIAPVLYFNYPFANTALFLQE